MSAIKRLAKELDDIKKEESVTSSFFYSILVDEKNLLHWEGVLVSDKWPFTSKGSKKVSC